MLLETYDVYRQKNKPNKAFLAQRIFKFILCAKTNWFQNNSHPMLRFSITTSWFVFLFLNVGVSRYFCTSLRKFKCSTYVCLFPVDVFHKMKVFPLVWGVSLTDFLASSLTSEQTLISWFAVILNLCDITTDYLLAICLFLHLNSLYNRCEYFHLKFVRSI